MPLTADREAELIDLTVEVVDLVKPHMPLSDEDRIFFDSAMTELMSEEQSDEPAAEEPEAGDTQAEEPTPEEPPSDPTTTETEGGSSGQTN